MRYVKTSGGLVAISGNFNALVPVDAPILPFQAYVDYATQLAVVFNSGAFGTVVEGLSHLNLASLTYTGVVNWASYGFYSFANGSLPTVDINDILLSIASVGASGVGTTLNLSGPNMGVPTPQQAFIAGSATLIFNGFPIHGDYFGVYGIGTYNKTVIFDNTIDFSDHSNPGVVGILDNPSTLDITNYLATYDGLTDGIILVTDEAELPLTDVGTYPIADFIAGRVFYHNVDIQTAVSNGATITVQEYVNRIGPQVLVSGAGVEGANGIYKFDSGNYVKGIYTIYPLNPTGWEIVDENVSYDIIYTSPEDTAEPWDAVFTSVDPLNDPAPTLTFVAGSADTEQVVYP